MPSVSKHVQSQQAMRTIPMATVRGFYVHLASLSFAETAKYGETGRWPSTHQFKLHLPSFLDRGFESHREALEVKFEVPVEPDQTMYTIQPFSIGYVDGQNKAIIMLSTLALLIDLVPFLNILSDLLSFQNVLPEGKLPGKCLNQKTKSCQNQGCDPGTA